MTKITADTLKGWGACADGINRFVDARPDGAEIETLILWANKNGWDSDANWLLSAFLRNGGILPAGLTTIGGYADLRGYAHPLPAGLTTIGGYAYLEGYAHPLPAGLTTIGGSADLRGYAHPLPAGLTTIGGYANLEGYAHPLPAGLAANNPAAARHNKKFG